ncbi:MAG: DUF3108 domain-containing protein [Planctomycetota bacterium]
MTVVALILLSLSTPAGGTALSQADEPSFLVVSRGEGLDSVEIPHGEELEYVVEVDVGLFGDIDAGRVTLSAGNEPYVAGLPAPGEKPRTEAPRRVGWLRTQARGAYLGYELKHDIESRHLPQEWPAAISRDTQAGSESRRRELKLGLREGKPTASYRNDGHCKGCRSPEHFVESTWAWGEPYHCKKCKRGEHRVWREPVQREVAPGSVDLLTAVYLARSMIRQGREESTFPVVIKQRQWIVTVTRGPTRKIETPAGRFQCALARLDTQIPPGEPPTDKGKFEGLFGLQGTIKIWMEVTTGIPVQISGELPVPVIGTLDVNVRLRAYQGAPESFAPVR